MFPLPPLPPSHPLAHTRTPDTVRAPPLPPLPSKPTVSQPLVRRRMFFRFSRSGRLRSAICTNSRSCPTAGLGYQGIRVLRVLAQRPVMLCHLHQLQGLG